MGISNANAKFLFYSKQQGVSFENALMLGRQHLYVDKHTIKQFLEYFKNNDASLDAVEFKDEYAEPLFTLLGAQTINSIDCSSYEGASITHDLNDPLPDNLKNTFTVVVDGGTIEHVFNFPNAIKSCMQALKVGGHYIGFTPANNEFGHGFYQFSPELYFRIFDESNGFKTKLIAVHDPESYDWYKISDPAQVKSRVQLTNSTPLALIVWAEKIAEKDIFASSPQQSDYVNNWALTQALNETGKYEGDSLILSLYRKLPRFSRILIRKIYDSIYARKTTIEGIGNVNPHFFEKMKI